MQPEYTERPEWDIDLREAIYTELRMAWSSESRVDATRHLNEAVALLFVARCPSEEDRLNGNF
jgi:hypothetical protein